MSPTTPPIAWRPPNPGQSLMDKYRGHINTKFHQTFSTTQQLQQWTVEHDQDFWLDLYTYFDIQPPLPAWMKQAYDPSVPISKVPKWFDGLMLNYTENVLRHADTRPDAVALIGVREGGKLDGDERYTWKELREKVRRIVVSLRKHAVRKGDVVAALVSTSVEAVALFLATAALGAVFSSISPDLGVEGCISRLKQVGPKILFADGSVTFKGKKTSTLPKVKTIVEKLDTKPLIFIIPIGEMELIEIFPLGFPPYSEFLEGSWDDKQAIKYERVPFNHPLVICYSSGTTGPPKCIVHQHGLLLSMQKTSNLHNSIGPGEVVLQYSSTSWVMFYIMNGHLSTGATVICFDGSPMWPDVRHFLRLIQANRVTYLGTSPRYLFELEKARVVPKKEFDLSSLRMVNTTGATLSTSQYHWFYANMPPTIHLCNSAGGTDSATSLIAADPAAPVYIGEMQIRGLGVAVDIADPETGESIADTNQPGEMVVRKPFPSMPAFFWGDSQDRKMYHAAYFERFEPPVDVWAQHDWLSFNPVTRGWTMHGRSDGVLNPSGIRFGSGEIYAIVESPLFSAEISDSLCVGRRRKNDLDETVFLFVITAPKPGRSLVESGLEERLRKAIRDGLSPRHVPKFMFSVKEIPVTVNGKKVEGAVKRIISGLPVKVSSTVANPGCLDSYKRFVEFEGPKTREKL